MWSIEKGLNRLAEIGIRHVGLADFETMAGLEQFDRIARGLSLEPWLGVTLRVTAEGGVIFPARLYALSPGGYRQLCDVLSRSSPPRLDHISGEDLLLSLPPDTLSRVSLSEEWLRRFGLVVQETREEDVARSGGTPSTRLLVPYWPIRFLDPGDFEAYRTLCKIGGQTPEPDAKPSPAWRIWRERFGQMNFSSDRAPVVLTRGQYHIPASAKSPEEEFRQLQVSAERGLRDRHMLDAKATARLTHELAIIMKLGFQGYFLLVAELTDWAREVGIRVGPGRGSAAGSIVSYALGITEVNPLKYGLIFERFLNPERGGLPDIDLDVDFSRRGEVLQHLRDHWGSERVAQIGAYGTLGSRAVLREVGKARGLGAEVIQRAMTVLDVDAQVSLKTQHEVVAEKLLPFDAHGEWLKLAEALEGLPRHASIHAAGVVISPKAMTEFLPVTAAEGHLVTQMEMDSVERLGLVKLDVLGLRTLSVIDSAETWISQEGCIVGLTRVPEADPRTLKLLAHADTDGVFQLDGHGVKRLLEQMRPRHLEEVMAVVALYRPGPMDAIPQYLKSRLNPNNPGQDPVDQILQDTYGVMVYQEQLMAIVRHIGGYSWAEADQFRRAVSKRDHQLMAIEEERLLRRLEARGMDGDQARQWIARIHSFGDYGFNKSHAAAYGLLAYYVAYLKANWPLAFWAAELSSLAPGSERMVRELQLVVSLGGTLSLPDINHSTVGFRPMKGGLLAGLGIIRGLGSEQARWLVEERTANGPYPNYQAYWSRAGRTLDARADQALKAAGTLSGLPGYDASPAQLSLFETKAGIKDQTLIDCVASFGFLWQVAEGPLYFSTEGTVNAGQLSGEIAEFGRVHPGPLPLVQVINRDKGKRWPVSVSDDFSTLEGFRQLEGIHRGFRRVHGVDKMPATALGFGSDFRY